MWASQPSGSTFNFHRKPRTPPRVSTRRRSKPVRRTECLICEQRVPSKGYWKHLRSHNGDSNTCVACTRPFDSHQNLQNHYKSPSGWFCRWSLRIELYQSTTPPSSIPPAPKTPVTTLVTTPVTTPKQRRTPSKVTATQNTSCIICNAYAPFGSLCSKHLQPVDSGGYQCQSCQRPIYRVGNLNHHYAGWNGWFCKLDLRIQHGEALQAATSSTQLDPASDVAAITRAASSPSPKRKLSTSDEATVRQATSSPSRERKLGTSDVSAITQTASRPSRKRKLGTNDLPVDDGEHTAKRSKGDHGILRPRPANDDPHR